MYKEYCPVDVQQSQSGETMDFRSAVNSTPTEPRQQRDRQPVKRSRVASTPDRHFNHFTSVFCLLHHRVQISSPTFNFGRELLVNTI
jgi:hypothetical protein